MTSDYTRHETPMAPGAFWPDGSRVSNWRQAVAALSRRSNVEPERTRGTARHAEILNGEAASAGRVLSPA